MATVLLSWHINKWELNWIELNYVLTVPRAHPAFYTMCTGSFPGIKRPGRGVNHPPPSSTEVKERVELYFYSPSGPSWSVVGRNLLYLCYKYTEHVWGRGRLLVYDVWRRTEKPSCGTCHPLSVPYYRACFPQTSLLNAPLRWEFPSGSVDRFLPRELGHRAHWLSLRLWRANMESDCTWTHLSCTTLSISGVLNDSVVCSTS